MHSDFTEFVHYRKKNKDEKIKEEVKKKKKEGLDNIMKEEEEKYERSIQCAERYQAWVEEKGKPRRGPPPPTLTQRYDGIPLLSFHKGTYTKF